MSDTDGDECHGINGTGVPDQMILEPGQDRRNGLPAISIIYIGYALAALMLFVALPSRQAIGISYIGGWLLLPVGSYAAYRSGFTVELIGAALPAPTMLVTKAWVAPVVTLGLAIVKERQRLLTWCPGWIDAPVGLWCLWPLIAGLLADTPPSPDPAVASAYLFGVWGAPWLLARLFLDDEGGRASLSRALVVGALAIAPAALAEGIARPFVHTVLYGPHPYVTDGVDRYVGFRPLLLFENGNQYGIFMALAAVAAVALWRAKPGRSRGIQALIVAGMAVLSQSVGAILLMILGIAWLLLPIHGKLVRRPMLILATFLMIVAPVYVSGVLPINAFVRETSAGQKLLALVRATGRGSIAWRISQDQKVASLIRPHPVAGTSQWDWWRPAQTRPWNLALLIVGQFGLLSFIVAACVLTAGSMRVLLSDERVSVVTGGLAVISLLASLDALLNSFVFLPALATAGAIARRHNFKAEKPAPEDIAIRQR